MAAVFPVSLSTRDALYDRDAAALCDRSLRSFCFATVFASALAYCSATAISCNSPSRGTEGTSSNFSNSLSRELNGRKLGR
jgi:hypothetical protein